MKFEEDFTMCKLSRIDFVLQNSFLDFYGVEFRRRLELEVVVVGGMGNQNPFFILDSRIWTMWG